MANEWLFPTNTETEEPRSSTQNEELFVFGYHCKLFRDDEQARMVDSGTYMIPWMGDEKLKIDRYDGRGHLFDLRPYDADSMKGQPPPELTEDEAQLEKLCDEERYLELHTDVAEKAMYEEEEWKRYYESLAEGYKAVGFSYDAYGQPVYTEEEPEEAKPNPDEAVYVPPKELLVPAGIPIPATVKENAIIEKTAKFIADHGIQMEIVMKTKQANNPQFFFMHFENTLHPYYKHLVKMIKTKKYVPKSPVKEEAHDSLNESGEGEDGGHGYLHPALMTTSRASPTPQEPYKPIPMPKVALHETPYGQLLQSFKKVNREVAEKRKEKEAKIKQEINCGLTATSSLPACVAQPEYGSMPPPPGIEPVQLPKSTGDNEVRIKEEPADHNESNNARTVSPPSQIVPPPPDLQPIIDRMAMYVAKNGEEFAIVVKSKNDPRFQFLETWHQHFPYYDFKRHLFQEEIDKEKQKKEAEEKKKEQEKAELLAKGVKFKLKKANKEQDSTTLEKKPVFEYDDSGDENDSDSTRDTKRSKSGSVSGTSTPVKDAEQSTNVKTSENLERKLAEQRLKDRLAASAREKLSQVDKEKQIKAERKKKAAMFINLLKSKNEVAEESQAAVTAATDDPVTSGTDTPIKSKDEKSSHTKSKHKHRDRSRSRDRKSRSRSRDRKGRSRRSRSGSKSRSKKKKRKRSPTPPSAYNVVRRSPLRFPPPPPPPRYLDMRTNFSRSPSRASKHRSRSRSRDKNSRKKSRSKSPAKSKSKKKKRSRSPKSKKDEASHHKKSSKKKKKRSRSRERKAKEVCEVSISIDSPKVTVLDNENSRVSSLAGSRAETEEPLEEGETRESTPEPGQITDTDTTYKDSPFRSPSKPPDIDSLEEYTRSSVHSSPRKRKRSTSVSSASSHTSRHSKSRSRSLSPTLQIGIKSSRSRSRSLTKSRSRSQSKVMSRSPSHSVSPVDSRSRSQSKLISRSPSRSRSLNKSRSASPVILMSRSPTKSVSQSPTRLRSRALSNSRSRSISLSKSRSRSRSPASSQRRYKSPSSRSVSREGTPASVSSRGVTPSASEPEVNGGASPNVTVPQKNVSSYMLNRVRAIIKASREAIRQEEDMFADDT